MRCSLEREHGRLSLVAGDRRLPPLIYCSGHPRADQVALFAELGVPLVAFPATCDHHLYGLAPTCWTGPDSYDDAGLERTLSCILEGNPDALLLPRVFSCSPPWWDAAHPEELVVWEDGSSRRFLEHGALKDTVPSLASARWRSDQERNLRRFVRLLENGPHAGRVVGYLVTSGNSEEWFHWGTMEGYLFDYAPCAQEAFRSWLQDRYVTPEALSAAWGRSVGFGEAAVPAPGRRRRGGDLHLRHPVEDRDVIDHALFLSELTAAAISRLAALVKEETQGRKLFGTFYGYLPELAYHPDGLQAGGHLALSRLIEDPHVDFLASPGSYARRDVGTGFTMPMLPTGSVDARGMAFFHENDVRTHRLEDDAGYGRTESCFQTASIQRRELASALTSSHGLWWFDMTGGWYDDAPTRDTLRRIVDVATRGAPLPRESVTEVALLLDEEALLHVEAPPDRLVHLLQGQCHELSRLGAPFEVLLLQDLPRRPRLRLLLVPALFHLDPARLAGLHRELRRRGATAVFAGWPGWATEAVKPGFAEALTGFRLQPAARPVHLLAASRLDGTCTRSGTASWWGRPLEVASGADRVLGRYEDSGAVAVAAREMEGWRSVFTGVPALAAPLLRLLAREAGVHLYVDTPDAVHACSLFVGLHARVPGVKELRVPGTDMLYDLDRDVELQRSGTGFLTYLPFGETALHFRGSRRAWIAATEAAARDAAIPCHRAG